MGGVTDRITAQAKLVLRQEDAMNALLLLLLLLLLLQMELMVCAQTIHVGLVDTLIEIWAEYHRRVDNIVQMARTPKQMIMAACFFKELELRSSQVIAKTEDGEKLRQELIKNQLLTSDGAKWNQMAWSQEREQLLPTDGEAKDIHATHKILTPASVCACADAGLDSEFSRASGHPPDGEQRWQCGASLEACDRTSRAEWKQIAPPLEIVVSSRSEAACVGKNPPGKDEWIASSAESLADDILSGQAVRDCMLTWAFLNYTQCCYMNACVWSISWCASHLHCPLRAWGQLRGLWSLRQQVRLGPLDLTQLPSLKMYLYVWRQDHPEGMHQDAAEFCAGVLRCLTGAEWGKHVARLTGEPDEVHTLECPIWLRMPLPGPESSALTYSS